MTTTRVSKFTDVTMRPKIIVATRKYAVDMNGPIRYSSLTLKSKEYQKKCKIGPLITEVTFA